MSETIPKPYFAEVTPDAPLKYDPNAVPPEDIADWARQVEQGIRGDPERYGRALSALGETATSGKLSSILSLNLEPVGMGAAIRLHTYFTIQADRSVIYDDATEEALAANSRYREALAAHKKAGSRTITVSSMSHKQLPNQKAGPARDAVRRLSLELYIARVAGSEDNPATD